ncbi:MAG: glycosyltransferase family 2 protein [Candidatus Auribacterota bacterium]|nr:glycosyltransferase family 2 protein [Candidatus Auribacterota bacterium]
MNEEQKSKFSLALPFYNEELNVVRVISGLTEELASAGLDFQLILVNNGSYDRTPDLIRELVRSDSRLKSVTVEKNIGYGWGVIRGLEEAEGEWIGFMDGDAQISPADAVLFLRSVTSDNDMVKVRRRERHDGFIRASLSESYIIFFCLLFGISIYDINAKPVMFKRELFDLLNLTSRDWFIDAELMLKADYLGLEIREVPVIFRKREAGRSNVKPATVIEFLINIARYRFGKELREWKKKTLSKL